MLRPWSDRPIRDCGESLEQLPPLIHRLEPHPYASLGAPYGVGADPFRLRESVIIRLIKAQFALQRTEPKIRLAVFDAWRPIAVQAFMVDHAIAEECQRRGVDRDQSSQSVAVQEVIEAVGRFWAPPSLDPSTPPPHSTGAAVDLTLAEANGMPLSMGGEIDAIGAISEPDHFVEAARENPSSEAGLWHQRRRLLADAMVTAGFAQHPHEWWHFSHGDQLWAWRCNKPEAIYGACSALDSNASTA